MSCIVKDCKNNRKNISLDKNISFHLFPKDDRQKNWLNMLGMSEEGWVWARHRTICSEHFAENNFCIRAGKRSLNANAIPSLKLGNVQTLIQSVQPDMESSVSFVSEASTSRVDTTLPADKSSTSTDESAIKRQRRKKRILQTGASISNISSTSSSTGSSVKRRRISFIKAIHSYSTSPRTVEKKNVETKKRQQLYRQKLYNTKRKVKALETKILNMRNIISYLKKSTTLSESSTSHLEKTYDSVPQLLMNRYLKNISNKSITHETYPSALREFAATLQFYSCKAYEEVRQRFGLALPHQATIRKWYKNVNCRPGFISVSFDALKIRVEEASSNNRAILCSLLLDEISVKKQLEFDGTQMWGYVNIGVPTENDQLDAATQALVLMVVSHTGHWKIPIAYFFITSLSGREKANIIKESLTRLYETGVIITSVTCDGPNTNFSMLRELGCNFDNPHQMQTWFYHPSDNNQQVFCVLDACHMLKLMRNNFASLIEFKDPQGNIIKWAYIKRLHELQENEGLHVANKLKRQHMEWFKQKMKVNLAAQTLSNSIADAIDFLNKNLNLNEFEGSEATTNFIRKVDVLFDILNSRSPFAKGLKSPLRMNNENLWRPFIEETVDFLLRCTDVGGRPLYMTSKKTPFIGFAITALSVMGIFDTCIKNKGLLSYLLTYKVSQDHLEIFFCSIRSRNGWNNNPTCLQFMWAFRRLLLNTKISGKDQGNCKVLDATTILTVPSTQISSTEEIIDISLYRKYGYEPSNQLLDHNYDIITNIIELNELKRNVVTYISGYVMKMLDRNYKCRTCLEGCKSLTDAVNDDSYNLISFKNKGGLIIPSYGVVKICESVEVSIRNLLFDTQNKLPKDDKFFDIFVMAVAQKFYTKVYDLFPNLNNHFFESSPMDENHSFILIKNIIRSYAKIRFFNLAKKYTENIRGSYVRQQLHHLILFNHQ